MKNLHLLLFLSLLFIFQNIYAQPCPPPGFPDPGPTCVTAPILCENLDGYCATLGPSSPPLPLPGCGNQWVLNNPAWFAFYAGTTSISIQITPNNCTPGANMGLQGGIYAGCGPPWITMDVQCQCTTNPFVLNSNNFVIGQIYWIVMDGCAGNICDYSIDVIVGSTVQAPPANPGPISGAINVCQGTTTAYNIAPPVGATIYNWTLTPPLGTISGTPNNNVNINWGNAPGTTQLCVTVANVCLSNPTPSCTTVTVQPVPTATLSGSGLLCASGGGPPGSVNLTVTFTGDPPWNFVYAINGTPQPPIQTSSNPYTLAINQPGTVTLTSVSTVNGNCPGTVSGSVTITQVQLNPTATTVAASCSQSNGSVNLTPAGGQAPYTFNWSNGATTEDLQNVAPGSYTVTITEGNGCTGTLSVQVGNVQNQPTVTSTTTPTTCELSNGIINITVSGGSQPYTFSWSNGATSEDLNNLMAGSYTVTVTGADGCTTTSTINLANNNPPITVNGNTVANTTCTGGNGSITTSVAPASPPGGGSYTYTWSNGATTPNLNNLPPGSYTVTVDGGGACTQTATFTIPDQPNTPNVTSATTPSICELANGDINITVSGGVAPYTFNWSNGATTEDLIDVSAGSYTVTVTGANGCTSTASVNLTNNNPPISVTANIVANTTCTGGNGSITASVVPATPPGGGTYTYTWSNGATGTSLSNLTPGSYTVTVDGGGACTQTATFTVPNQPNLPVISQTVTPANCGQSNGSVNVTVSGGVPPYTFNWSNGSTTEDLSNVAGGSYSVTVTGANGCTASTAISVPDNPITFTISPTILPNTSCNNNTNGSISISVSPSGNYTYTWSNGATGTNLTNLAPGSYSVTVSAGGNCTQTMAFNVPNQPNVPTLSSNLTPATCGQSNGSVTVITSGGVGPFSYNWSNGSTTQTLNNVPGGNYSVTVTGFNGCTAASSFTIPNNNIPITITPVITPNTSCGAPNGGISISVQPANTAITWSNGASGTNLTNLAPGNYSVTISAGGTCVETANFTVPDNSEEPNLSALPTPSSCNLPNGAIDLSISGGLPPYAISWSNGATSPNLTNLLAGTYSVIVTSSTGCISTATVNVPNNDPVITITGLTSPNTSCGIPNGGIGLNVQPPLNYTYQWSNGQTGDIIDNLPAGIYNVVVSAGGTCVQAASFEVSEFTSPPNLSFIASPATCGQNNGSVNLSVNGIALPYTYSWSNGATTEDLNNVPPGTYTVVVTDGNFCTSSASATVSNNTIPVNITGATTANTSCSGSNGAVNITVNPAGSYTFTWSNAATTEDISNLAAGTYTVTVSAGGNCTATSSFTVANQTQNPVISENITAAICGESNGGINLTVTGATPPYTFTWSNGATTEDISSVPPGSYSVTVSGVNGCSSTATYSVPNNSSNFTLTGTAQPINTCVYDNGAINLTITPSGTYDIQWSNGATTEDLDSLSAGTYTVVVTESGACSASASFTITNTTTTPTASSSITAALCGQNDGAVDITVSGGTAPYTFYWSNGAITEDLSNIPAGAYSVVVTGANGCSTTASANVPDNSISFSVNGTAAPNTSCDVNNGSINLTVTPAGTYTFLWSNGETTEDISGLSGGSYTVTVSAGGTCTSEANFNVGSTTADPVLAQTVTAAVCGESNGAINLNVSGGVAPFNFVWSNAATSEDIANLAPGNYSVEVTGANGCTITANYTVPNNNIVLSVNGTTAANTSCDNANGGINISVTPAGTYNYLWSNAATTEDITGLAPGNYSVTVSQGLTCSAEASFNVGNNTNAPNFSQNITPASCGESNGSINLTASGGTMPYTFLWSNGATTEDISQVTGGSYTVTVTGADGCSNTATYNVPDDLLPINITGSPSQNTACTNGNGSIDVSVTPAWAYTFLWSNGLTTEDITGLSGGSYEVTVSAGGTCTSVASFTIPDNPDVPSLTQTITASICGAPDGGIDLTVTGGQTPYQFSWNNGATTEDLTGIASGTYSVVVTAANGCTVTGSYNVPNNSNTFTFTGTTAANTLCGSGNGTVNLTVVPAGSYTFIWSNGETTEDISGLLPGTYSVTVSDGGSCTASADFVVGNNAPTVSVSGTAADALCFGENSGAINLTPGGGVAPYSFDWSPAIPGNPEDPANLAAGSYSVVVTDASGCTGTASFSVGQPASAVQVACTQSGNVSLPGMTDGEGSVNISGGVAPYTVVWTPGSSQGNVPAGNFTINNLGEGSYAIEVTDANGCKTTCGFTITTDDCVTAIGSMQTGQLSACASDCITASYNSLGQYLDQDDLLQFILHQGTGNQIVNEIARSDQPTFCFNPTLMNYGTTYYISAAAGNDDGTGNVLLSDACTKVTIGTPVVFYEVPVAGTNQPAPITCIATQVNLTGSSSVPGSTFSWSTQGGTIIGNPSQASIQAGAGGFYTLIVSANGCKDTVSVQVTNLQTQVSVSLASSPGEILDCVVSQVQLTATVTGTGNPSYLWLLDGVQAGAASSLVANASGTYQVVVTDQPSGCTGTASVFIEDDSDFPPLFVNPAPILNCKDTVVTVSGGSSANGVQFFWATVSGTDTTIIGQGANWQVNAPGTYYLIGVAPNGCDNAQSLTVSADLAAPTANAGQDQWLDCLQTPLTLTGSGSPGISFLWTANNSAIVISNPASPSITVNQTGVYTLTVTNLGNYCTDTDDVEVFQYENVPQGELTLQPPSCFGEKDGFITVETDPANGPYQYQLNGKNYGGNNVFAPLGTGYYQLQVTDGKGCVWTTEVYLPEPEQLTVSLGADLIVKLGETATLEAIASVPVWQLDTILWTPTELFPCPQMPCDKQEFLPTQQTSVGVTVIDENGCEASDILALFVKKERNVYVPNSFSPNGDGINDVFMIFAGKEAVEVKSFLVFDRWGETVFQYYNFEPNNPAYGWDGTHRGETLNPAVFAWFAVVEFIDGKEELFEGDVMLMK